MLAEFSSVVDAVRCAIDVQRGMAERNAGIPRDKRIDFRIGINVGDVIIDGADIFGDGVNVAVRLEGIAEPGAICVSARVQEYVQGRVDITFKDAGEQRLKNISQPVRVYRLTLRKFCGLNGNDRRLFLIAHSPPPPARGAGTLPQPEGEHKRQSNHNYTSRGAKSRREGLVTARRLRSVNLARLNQADQPFRRKDRKQMAPLHPQRPSLFD